MRDSRRRQLYTLDSSASWCREPALQHGRDSGGRQPLIEVYQQTGKSRTTVEICGTAVVEAKSDPRAFSIDPRPKQRWIALGQAPRPP